MIESFDGVVPFVRVADHGSFRAAAAELGVTPAAVSKAVKRLEAELGVTLLHRTTRSVRLSDEGAVFLARAKEAIAQLEAGRAQVAMSRREARGVVRISASFVVGRFLISRLGGFAARYPGLRFDLRLTDRNVRLVDERVDVAVRIGRLADSELVARKLRDTRWVTLASPAYLARRGTPEEPADLEGHDLVAFRSPRGKTVPFRFASGDFDPESRVRVDQGELVLEAAAGGLGIAQVFGFMAADPLRAGRLVEILETHAAVGPPLHAVTTRARRRLPRVRVTLRFLGDLFA